MALEDVITLNISRTSSALTADGFGRALILGFHTRFAERARIYTKAADMLVDGFVTGDAIYQQALVHLSQRPRPKSVVIGRRAAAVAQTQVILTPATPGNLTLYRFVFNGSNIDYTTDGTATQAELRDGLILFFNNPNLNPWASRAVASASGNNILITSATAGVGFTVTIDAAPVANPLLLAAQTQLFVIPAAPGNSTLYRITINGVVIPFTTDSTATQTELRDGILAAINASSVAPAVTATTATNDVLVTADFGGTPFTYSIDPAPITNPITLGAATNLTANVGIADDIAAVQAYQSDWYGLLIPERDAATIMAAAPTIESMRKLFFAQVNDPEVTDVVFSAVAGNNPNTDLGTRLSNLNYARTSLWWQTLDTEYADAAIMAIGLAQVPGSITFKFKDLAGVTANKLTATQRANLVAKFVNSYEPIASRSMTFEGTVAEGEFIDIIHGIDKLYSRIQVLMASTLLKNPKIPFTTGGIATLAADVTTALGESAAEGLIAPSRTNSDGTIQVPAFTVTPPKIQDIPSVDRAARTLTSSHPIVFEGTLAGAIHAVTITGTLSV